MKKKLPDNRNRAKILADNEATTPLRPLNLHTCWSRERKGSIND